VRYSAAADEEAGCAQAGIAVRLARTWGAARQSGETRGAPAQRLIC